jgi:hypothetical protein
MEVTMGQAKHPHSLWESLRALKSFKSAKAQALQEQASQALGALPEDIPTETAEAIFCLFLERDPPSLWRALSCLPAVHYGALSEAARYDHSLQARLLVEAYQQGELGIVARYLSFVEGHRHVSSLIDELKGWLAPLAPGKKKLLYKIASEVLFRREKSLEAPELKLYWALVWLVARGGARLQLAAEVRGAIKVRERELALKVLEDNEFPAAHALMLLLKKTT